MKFSTAKLSLLLAMALCALMAKASGFMPLVTNFAQTEQLCRNQTWDCSQDSTGVMYFANNDGLLAYDGFTWSLHPVPGDNIVRSVYCEGSRIYVGSYAEFGYFERDRYGQLIYTSLSADISDFNFTDEEIWKILRVGSYIYFQTFNNWFSYDGKKVVEHRHPDMQPLYLFAVGGGLYAQMMNHGLYFIDVASGAFMQMGNYFTPEQEVVSMLENKATSLVYIFTDADGIYTLRNHQFSRFVTAVDAQLRSEHINRAIITKDGNFIIGTIRNGIYAINSAGELLWHYSMDNGLGNNSILGLCEDLTGNVWACLDYGIALIRTALPITFLTPGRNEPYIGMTYAVQNDANGNLLLGTNQGLYVYDHASHSFHDSPLISSQIWHINRFDGQTFVGNNFKTYVLNDAGAMEAIDGAGTSIARATIHGHDVLIQSSYFDLRIYTKTDQGWKFSHIVEGFGAPIRQIQVDYDGSIWCSHLSEGCYRIKLSPDLRHADEVKRMVVGTSGHTRCYVMRLRGRVVVSDRKNLYVYDHSTSKLHPLENFATDLPSVTNVVNSTPVNDYTFWIASTDRYTLVEYANGHYHRLTTIPLQMFSLQSNGVSNTVYVDDNATCYFTINNGVGRLNSSGYDSGLPGLPHLHIGQISSLTDTGETIFLPITPGNNEHIEIPGNVNFTFALPNYNSHSAIFRYRLTGPKKQEIISTEPTLSLGGLSPGSYTLTATLIDGNDNSELDTITYSFSVSRPKFLSWGAILAYVLLLMAIIYDINRWYSRRELSRREVAHQMEAAAQNIKILEQERIIAEQQNQLLESELSNKSKELASMALDVYARQQVIDNLKSTIREHRLKSGSDSPDYDQLMRAINSDIGDSEFWAIYQKNFDLIHENFFRNLSASYPSLTPVDLKFCALLRLNLSTKDIAKLTNLTIRGVETARYRLRRKFGLSSQESLVQFLIDIKNDNTTN